MILATGRNAAFLICSSGGVILSTHSSVYAIIHTDETTITAKLKLHTTPAQFKALRTTQLTYRDALNYVSQYAYAHGKMSNKVGLQEANVCPDTCTLQAACSDGL